MKNKKTRSKHISSRIKKTSSSHKQSYIGFSRTIIYISCLLLIFTIIGYTNHKVLTRSVEGASIVRFLYGEETVPLPRITEAVTYNIYYKQTSEPVFTNSVRSIPASITSYTISYLRKGSDYVYRISALNASGSEFWWSSTLPL